MDNIFQVKQAFRKNIPQIQNLMGIAIQNLQKPFLSQKQIKASYDVMGLDTQLIDDGTYFVIWTDKTLVGCGGWSLRKTLYGGNHTKGRSADLLDPDQDAARIRAMYTHPDWIRRGIGKMVLETCENAAKSSGFHRAEMMATLAGVPLYKACGYSEIEVHTDKSSDGIEIPLVRMGRAL